MASSALVPNAEIRRVVVRAGLLWWALLLAGVGFNVMMMFIAIHDPSASNGLPVAPLGGLFFGAVLAIVTERIALSGRTLTAVGAVTTYAIDVRLISGVQAANGLTLMLPDGKRLTLAITQSSLAQSIMNNRRRRREGEEITTWVAEPSWLAEPGVTTVQRSVRWTTALGIPLWCASCLVIAALAR